MKKKPLLLVVILFIYSTTIAQNLSFGVKGGLNFNSIGELYHIGELNGGGLNVIPYEDTYYQADKEMSFHVGMFAMLRFNKVFIRPEIVYTSLKNSYPLSQKTANWTATKIDIPMLVGVNVYKPVSIYAGPVLSRISTMELEGTEQPIIFKKTTLGLNAGILINYRRFGLDLRYEHQGTTVNDQRIDIVRAIYGTNVAYLQEYTPSQFIISIHFNLINFNLEDQRNKAKINWRSKKCPN